METKIIEQPWHQGENQYFGPETRSLYFSGPINEKTTYALISQLLELNARGSQKPIKLYINTEGGSLTDAFAIYDTIQNMKCEVHTIVKGLCSSGGLIICLAGHKRYSTKNSLFFYHQPLLTMSTLVSLEQSAGVSKAYDLSKKLFDGKIKQSTNMSDDIWEKDFEGKTYKYFSSQQAKEYGFINSIISQKGDK